MKIPTTPRSRRSFFRQAGLTLAAGVGIAVATVVTAQASVSYRCCPSSCRTCNTKGQRAFTCINSSTCEYCTCSSNTACYTAVQPSCP